MSSIRFLADFLDLWGRRWTKRMQRIDDRLNLATTGLVQTCVHGSWDAIASSLTKE
jgi:hypothetical protein